MNRLHWWFGGWRLVRYYRAQLADEHAILVMERAARLDAQHKARTCAGALETAYADLDVLQAALTKAQGNAAYHAQEAQAAQEQMSAALHRVPFTWHPADTWAIAPYPQQEVD